VIGKRGHQTAKDIFALASLVANSRAAAAAKSAAKTSAKAEEQRGLFARLLTKR
jgi:hypothetical protein